MTLKNFSMQSHVLNSTISIRDQLFRSNNWSIQMKKSLTWRIKLKLKDSLKTGFAFLKRKCRTLSEKFVEEEQETSWIQILDTLSKKLWSIRHKLPYLVSKLFGQ